MNYRFQITSAFGNLVAGAGATNSIKSLLNRKTHFSLAPRQERAARATYLMLNP